MESTLSQTHLEAATARLAPVMAAFNQSYPGESPARQPVHTVYGGAHLFKAETPQKLGELALRALDTYAPDFLSFAHMLGLRGAEALPSGQKQAAALVRAMDEGGPGAAEALPDAWLAHTVYQRVRHKLQAEPVEDFRLDFEDGYGNRPDDEEDATALAGAREVARGAREGLLPPFIGLRIKPFNLELKGRSLRTLDLFLGELVRSMEGEMPPGFVVTLPKVVRPEQVAVLAELLGHYETELGLAAGQLKLEIMVEMPQALFARDGSVILPALVQAGQGRCVAAHFGTYDYTAGCSITAAHQHMTHPACDFARHVMQVALAGTGVWLSDGATNIMPVPAHREGRDGPLDPARHKENVEAMGRSWRIHYQDVRHSLYHAYYQGWDLHPAQLPTRYAAVYAFFLEGLSASTERLGNFIQKAAQATLVGDVFDDAATGQGLLNFFLRGLSCGAITEAEALATGLTLDELHSRSFLRILEGRRGG